MGGLVLKGTEAKILSDVVAQFYAYLSGCMFNDPVGMAIYAELHYMMSSLMLGAVSYTHLAFEGGADRRLYGGNLEAIQKMGRHPHRYHAECQRPAFQP